MFDWFRDVAFEVMGKNCDEEKIKHIEKKEHEKREKIIFSKGTKRIVYFLGTVYLVMGGVSIYVSNQISKQMGIDTRTDFGKYAKYIVLSLIDTTAMLCLMKKNKKTEIVAIILIIMFMILMYLSSVIFPFV